jgi:acetylornithine/N-succinyldiaminopimelate aminotransferase
VRGCCQAFEQLLPNHDHLFREIRGKGLDARHQAQGAGGFARVRRALARQPRLLTVAAGENVFRVLPPLI